MNVELIPIVGDELWVAIDCETTGFPPCRVIEVAGVLFCQNGVVLSEFDRLARPSISIPAHITELTGITDRMVQNERSAKAVICDLFDWIPDRAILVGHNIQFDLEVMRSEFPEMTTGNERLCVDTLELARSIGAFSDNRLATICQELFADQMPHMHRGLNDAKVVCRFLLEVLSGTLKGYRRLIRLRRVSDYLKQ